MEGKTPVQNWTLTYGSQVAEVVARGGALRSYRCGEADVVDGFRLDEVPPAFNGAVLAPWPNRLRDAQWTHRGVLQQLAVNEPTTGSALHGLVAWTDWQQISAADAQVALACRVLPQPGYPFELSVEVAYSLSESGLRCDMSAQNHSPDDAPFGCSTHPFFGFAGLSVDDIELLVPARARMETDDRLLPTQLQPTVADEGGALTRLSLDGVRLDNAFTDLERDGDGRSSVTLYADDDIITVWADEAFGWWQIYTSDMFDPADPRYRRSVAVEPMTCGPDAFNTGHDVIWLGSGERWQGSWGVTTAA
jgi:aldose 1-epimerase